MTATKADGPAQARTGDSLAAADASGLVRALPPRQAAARVDAAWGRLLDDLPDVS